jgi:hypothetical protein
MQSEYEWIIDLRFRLAVYTITSPYMLTTIAYFQFHSCCACTIMYLEIIILNVFNHRASWNLITYRKQNVNREADMAFAFVNRE